MIEAWVAASIFCRRNQSIEPACPIENDLHPRPDAAARLDHAVPMAGDSVGIGRTLITNVLRRCFGWGQGIGSTGPKGDQFPAHLRIQAALVLEDANFVLD